jgi:hypothetical protein
LVEENRRSGVGCLFCASWSDEVGGGDAEGDLGECVSFFFFSTFLVQCKGTALADLGSVERYDRDRREYNCVFAAGEGEWLSGRHVRCQ